jgi:coenzyme F420-0:L-glutamate ligase / coenzyme F420-1:gamma-L-glutamate ligase
VTNLEIRPVPGLPEVKPGDDLAALIREAAPWLADGDVLVVTSKIVSKAEGRLVPVPESGPEREGAREAVLARETARTVAARGHTRIVQTHHGFVMASAGIDASNVDRGHLVLLPVDPDASARSLRAALREHGLDVAVIVSDTMGRPWRTGLTDVALGVAGIEPLRDYRGETDAYGNELHITQMAQIDELAAAAELVKGKVDQVPVAVVRGFAALRADDGAGAAALVRDAEHDLFALGTAEARALGRHEAATLADPAAFAGGEVDPAAVDRALATVGAGFDRVTDPAGRDKLRDLAPPGTAEIVVPAAPPDPMSAARAGATVHRLRAALAAQNLASAWVDADPATVTALAPLRAGTVPLGLLAVGRPDG